MFKLIIPSNFPFQIFTTNMLNVDEYVIVWLSAQETECPRTKCPGDRVLRQPSAQPTECPMVIQCRVTQKINTRMVARVGTQSAHRICCQYTVPWDLWINISMGALTLTTQKLWPNLLPRLIWRPSPRPRFKGQIIGPSVQRHWMCQPGMCQKVQFDN